MKQEVNKWVTTVVEKANERKLGDKPFSQAKSNWDSERLSKALKEVLVSLYLILNDIETSSSDCLLPSKSVRVVWVCLFFYLILIQTISLHSF